MEALLLICLNNEVDREIQTIKMKLSNEVDHLSLNVISMDTLYGL